MGNKIESHTYPSGTKVWTRNGKLHRDNGLPAIERANGCREWWVRGKRRRCGGLPAVIEANGMKIYLGESWDEFGSSWRANDRNEPEPLQFVPRGVVSYSPVRDLHE